MIEHLRVGKTANFYRLKRRLSNAAIDDLFRRVRANQPSASHNFFDHRRTNTDGLIWSAISFLYDRSPSFFLDEAEVMEKHCGFLLLVEYRDHIALFKSGLEIPVSFSTRYLGRVRAERINVGIAHSDAIFEKIRLRNMSISKYVMRNKTLEADDLRTAVGPSGSSHYAPQGYTIRSGADYYSTTTSTGRIAQRSDRVDHATLIQYAKSVVDALVDGAEEPAPFIRTFAQPIDLDSVRGNVHPSAFAVDVAYLADALYERKEIRIVRKEGLEFVELAKAEIDLVLAELATNFEVVGAGTGFNLQSGGDPIGVIVMNKSRVALRDLRLPLSANLEVERTECQLGHDPNRLSLRRYCDREDAFILLFDQLDLAYINGTLFRDPGLVSGGGAFLRYLRADPLLATVTDEKGTFTRRHTSFDSDSTFGAVAASIADGDDILVCDDLGDEWADFVGLSNGSSPPRITFYHAKHGNISLGAGPFHVSVSQAIKNLGNMNLIDEAVARKLPLWRSTYVSGAGVSTEIPRVVRGNPNTLSDEFAKARGAPDAIRRVFIVTSSLSRRAVDRAFTDIALGQRPEPYFVQLYWLLLSFFSACTEVGAHGYVICQE